LSYRIKFAQVKLADTSQVVVPHENGICAKFNHLVDAFSRPWTVPNGVADVPKSIKFAAFRKHSFERFQVRMDIGDNDNFH
jgi:hypothetical protein